jgi:C4-dicarboxylate-specific signal transduction histidine kinase
MIISKTTIAAIIVGCDDALKLAERIIAAENKAVETRESLRLLDQEQEKEVEEHTASLKKHNATVNRCTANIARIGAARMKIRASCDHDLDLNHKCTICGLVYLKHFGPSK